MKEARSKSYPSIFFIIFIFGFYISSYGQGIKNQNSNKPELPITNEDEDSSSSVSEVHSKSIYGSIFSDFEYSNIRISSSGVTQSGGGYSWALGGQIGFRLTPANKKNLLLFYLGLEVKNFNATISSNDGDGGTAYDNYHYWYASIPLMIQLMSNPEKTKKVGFYGQLGLLVGFKAYMLDVTSIESVNKWQKTDSAHNTFILQPFISGGVSIYLKKTAWLIGPYIGCTANNISNMGGVNESIISYGIRVMLSSK